MSDKEVTKDCPHCGRAVIKVELNPERLIEDFKDLHRHLTFLQKRMKQSIELLNKISDEKNK